MMLKPAPTSTRQFTYLKDRREFVACMSDLYRGPGSNVLERVYDDACDVGLTLVSHVTGLEIVFSVQGETRDDEGELQYVTLEPADPWVRELCPEASLKVVLFND